MLAPPESAIKPFMVTLVVEFCKRIGEILEVVTVGNVIANAAPVNNKKTLNIKTVAVSNEIFPLKFLLLILE